MDVAKFLFSIIIVLYHADHYFNSGYLVVEAFFMISGYFMMRSLAKTNSDEPVGLATGKFIAHKYKSIAFFLIPSAIIGCWIYSYIIPRETDEVIMQATLMLFEMIPMQVAGFFGFWTTGVSWYLSALFLGLLILFPLAYKFRSNFTLTVCPLIAILLYGYLGAIFNNLDVPNAWINHSVNSGLLRGIAGIAAGCFLYECCERLKDKKVSWIGKGFFTVLEIIGWQYCIYVMHEHPRTAYDFVVCFLMFGLLLIGINRYSLLSYCIQFKWTRHLATISTVIYLNHYYWNMYLRNEYPDMSDTKRMWIYLALIAVTSAVVFAIGRLSMFLWDRRKRKAVNAAE